MSHTIKITRRITTKTTVTRGPTMGLNKEYLKKIKAYLQIAETLVGAVTIGLCAGGASRYNIVCLSDKEICLLVIAVACLITTFLMFVCNLCHPPTEQTLPKTLFELLFHCVAFLLYLAGSITVMVAVNQSSYHGSRYTELLIAAIYVPFVIHIFALVNTILYLASAIFSYKEFKSDGGD